MTAATFQKLSSVYLRAQLSRLEKWSLGNACVPRLHPSGICVRLPRVYIENSEFEGAKNVVCVRPLSCDVHFSLISNQSPVGTCPVMKILVLRLLAIFYSRESCYTPSFAIQAFADCSEGAEYGCSLIHRWYRDAETTDSEDQETLTNQSRPFSEGGLKETGAKLERLR